MKKGKRRTKKNEKNERKRKKQIPTSAKEKEKFNEEFLFSHSISALLDIYFLFLFFSLIFSSLFLFS